MNVNEAWSLFINNLSLNRFSPHTQKQYRIDGKHFISAMERLDRIENSDCLELDILEIYKKELLELYTSKQTINRKLSSLRSFVSFSANRGWIKEDVSSLIKLFPKEKSKIQSSNQTIERALVELFRSKQYQAKTVKMEWLYERNALMVECMVQTGVKTSEIIHMKPAHLINYPGYLVVPEKGIKHRLSPISDMLKEKILCFYQKTIELFSLIESPEYIWIGLGKSGQIPLNEKMVERVFRIGSENLEVRVTATTIRYGLIENKKEVVAAYQQLGYSRSDTLTERINLLEQTKKERR